VEIIDFSEYLCESGMCRTQIENTFIYRDEGHLSYEGSVFLANKVGLVSKIRELAR